jgi:hypothetical protein
MSFVRSLPLLLIHLFHCASRVNSRSDLKTKEEGHTEMEEELEANRSGKNKQTTWRNHGSMHPADSLDDAFLPCPGGFQDPSIAHSNKYVEFPSQERAFKKYAGTSHNGGA